MPLFTDFGQYSGNYLGDQLIYIIKKKPNEISNVKYSLLPDSYGYSQEQFSITKLEKLFVLIWTMSFEGKNVT